MTKEHTTPLTQESHKRFEPDDPKYFCCCGRCNLKKATCLIAYLELFLISVGVISLVYVAAKGQDIGVNKEVAYGMFGHGAAVCIILLMVLGIKKDIYELIIPHLVLQCVGVVSMALMSVLMVTAVAADNHEIMSMFYDYSVYDKRKDLRSPFVTFIVTNVTILFIVILLEIYFFLLILRCYRMMKDERESRRHHRPRGKLSLRRTTKPADV